MLRILRRRPIIVARVPLPIGGSALMLPLSLCRPLCLCVPLLLRIIVCTVTVIILRVTVICRRVTGISTVLLCVVTRMGSRVRGRRTVVLLRGGITPEVCIIMIGATRTVSVISVLTVLRLPLRSRWYPPLRRERGGIVIPLRIRAVVLLRWIISVVPVLSRAHRLTARTIVVTRWLALLPCPFVRCIPVLRITPVRRRIVPRIIVSTVGVRRPRARRTLAVMS